MRPLRFRWLAVCSLPQVVICVLAFSGDVAVRAQTPAASDPPLVADAGGAPMSYSGGGSFYSQSLGTHLRVRYNTQSYGQSEGNFNIGTMKLWNWGVDALFIDGQVTMNDNDGIGYNVGGGYRWMQQNPFAFLSNEPTRLMGLSLWSDGSSTYNENFFPQVGVSFESLGDLSDWRANLYMPVGHDTQDGPLSTTGNLGFLANSLVQQTVGERDHALTIGELEWARRLGNREAWGFVGGYAITSNDFDTEGFKVGVRGYALPDLMLQFAVTDDDLFKTNAVFSIAWFIGRTRSDYCPTCTLADRMRDPVLRNDYVAVHQSRITGGNVLTDADGETLRIVHVDSTAAAGGTGTYESPLSSLADINGNSQAGDIVLVHSGSAFTNQQAVLRANQRLLGEGNSVAHAVVTSELGSVDLPATASGSLAGAIPTITQTGATTSITLADANEVNNLSITGGTTGISGLVSAGDPTLRNLSVANTTGDAITLKSFARADAADADGDGDTTEIAFNATIDNVALSNIGGNGIVLDAESGADPTNVDTDLNEAISVSRVTSTNGAGRAVVVRNTNAGGTATIDRLTYNGGSTSLGGVQLEETAGTAAVTNSSFTGGAAGGVGIDVDTATGTVNLASTNTINNVTGTAIRVNEGSTTVTVANAITNSAGDALLVENRTGGNVNVTGVITNNSGAGRSLVVQNNTSGTVTVTGNISDSGSGMLVQNNTGGTLNVNGTTNTFNTGASAAVTATNNTNAVMNFNNLGITTSSGTGFVATGGGTVGVAGTSTIRTTSTGTGLNVQNMTIASGGLEFDSVNVEGSGATNGILVNNTTGGQITVGSSTGADASGGTIRNTTSHAISVTNATNVDINSVTVENAGGRAFLGLHNDSDAYDVRLANFETVTNGDLIEADANGSGDFDLAIDAAELAAGIDLAASNSQTDVDFTLQNSTLATGDNSTAVNLNLANLATADVIIRDNANIQTGDASALVVNGNTGTVRFLINNSDLVNSSGSAETADITGAGSVIFNANVLDSSFTNNGAANDFAMTSNNTAQVRLSLLTNTAGGGSGVYQLEETGGTFSLFDKTDTFADLNNQGNVQSSNEAGIDDDAGNIPQPQ